MKGLQLKNTFFGLLLLFGLLSYSPVTQAKELVFICHKGLGYPKLLIKRAYSALLDEPHLVDNKNLKPELLVFLGSDEHKYKKVWDKQYFRRALLPPTVRDTDAEVVEFVSSHPEGVGYVSSAPSGHPEIEVCGL